MKAHFTMFVMNYILMEKSFFYCEQPYKIIYFLSDLTAGLGFHIVDLKAAAITAFYNIYFKKEKIFLAAESHPWC